MSGYRRGACAGIKPLVFVSLCFSIACSHTESFVTGDLEPLGPLGTGYQITFNAHGRGLPVWSGDGSQVLYTYETDEPTAVKPSSRCIGRVPSRGGTRTFTLCDVRALQRDSSSLFSAMTFRPNGELLFLQSIGKPSATPIFHSKTLWLVDSASPLAKRTLLASFPKVIGGSVIDFLSDAMWTDENSFIANGQLVVYPCRGGKSCPRKDTLFAPLRLVRGTMNGSAVTWSPIAGSDSTMHWTRGRDNEILFVRGGLTDDSLNLFEQSTVYSIPMTGGVPAVVANFSGRAVRGLSCAVGKCVVLTSVGVADFSTGAMLHSLNLATGTVTQMTTGALNLNLMSNPAISPDGTSFIYLLNGNLFRMDLP